jgi:hypothetical protein
MSPRLVRLPSGPIGGSFIGAFLATLRPSASASTSVSAARAVCGKPLR